MISRRDKLERDFFRALNGVVEPAVRRGLLSPRYAPLGLIVLESTGFKSGVMRRTPLLASRLGKYVFVSTVRGRSFWVKNLTKHPGVRFHMGGRVKAATAYVFTASAKGTTSADDLPPVISEFARRLVSRAPGNLSLAVLRAER